MNTLKNTSRSFLHLNVNYKKLLSPIVTTRQYSTKDWQNEEVLDITSLEETPKYMQTMTEKDKQLLQQKRNKSGLNPSDYRKFHGQKPYEEDLEWFHKTIRYKRRVFGRYGVDQLSIPVGALWLTKEGIQDKIDYEKCLHPHSLQENWATLEQKRKDEEEKIRKRDAEIEAKLSKVEQWENELRAKIAKKEEIVKVAAEKKARLVDEVRRQLGFEVDPRDDLFKEALQKKEKEDKKLKKEAKKAEHAARVMAKLLEQSQEVTAALKKASDETKVVKKPTEAKEAAENEESSATKETK